MNINFGTPARLERQIAQDLLASQSDFDLSVPGGDTRDISVSVSRTPLRPSNRHNASFSRPSDNSSFSTKRTLAQNQPTPRQPVSLASAVLNAQQFAQTTPSSVSSNSPTEKQMGVQPALSSSSSTSVLSETPHSPDYKDQYGHMRSDSPPLTSTPQRTGPASTVGSRSRTTMTVRPTNGAANRTASSYHNDTTTASRHMQSARSASAVLDDLTESSIAPEDLDERDSGSSRALARPSAVSQDLIVYDAPSPAVADASRDSEPQVATRLSQRRAERRRFVQADESTVYQDESIVPTDTAQYGSSQARNETINTQTTETHLREDTATAYSSPAAARLARQVVGPSRLREVATPIRETQNAQDTPRPPSTSVDQDRMKQYLLNSVRATEKVSIRARSSDAHAQVLDSFKNQAELHDSPVGSRSDGLIQQTSSTASTLPTPRRRMDRLGKANTFAAGRTPLPKGGVAELLRRGALFGVPDRSVGSIAGVDTPSQARRAQQNDDQQSNAGSSAGGSEASSFDLTAAPNASRRGALGLRANTSFPGLGAAEAGTEANSVARPRVDAAKLALYQSKLNARLDAENEELKHERDALLRKILQLETVSGSTPRESSAEVEAVLAQLKDEQEKNIALDKEAQDLADLLDVKEQQLNSLHERIDSFEQQGLKSNDQNLLAQIEELQTLLKERDEDVDDLETRLEQERQHMEEQVQQAKAYSFETLDKVEAARDDAQQQVASLQAQLAAVRLQKGQDAQSTADRTLQSSPLSEQLAQRNLELSDERAKVQLLTQQTSEQQNEMEELQSELRLASEKLRISEDQLKTFSSRDKVADIESRNTQLSEKLHEAESELAKERAEIRTLTERISQYEVDVRDLQEDLNQANEDLDNAEQRLAAQSGDSSDQSQVETLRVELEDARQQLRVLQRFNARKDAGEDKDVQITLLREQKTELEKRVQHYREVIAQSHSSSSPNTPGKYSSPLPKSVQSLRNISAAKTPRSPGPLSSASWLYNESSLGAAGVNERIAYLEGALDEANASIDAKLQQLDLARVASDRDRLRAERDEIIRDVGMFEAELRRLRQEADQQGQDLEVLRAEREASRRQREQDDREKDEQRADFLAQVQTLVHQLKTKTHEVDRIKTKLDSLERSRSSAAPPPYVDTTQAMSELKTLHEEECKGLMLQIKYLKLRLGREMDLRKDLTHQKQYIGLLLKGLLEVDDEVGKIIFDLQIDSQKRQFDRYKAEERTTVKRWNRALTAVTAVVRMQRLAKSVTETRAIKAALQQAHVAVQTRRSTAKNEPAFATAKKIRRAAQ